MSDGPSNALALLERLVGFDTESSRSNLDLVAFVEAELARHGVVARRFPNASGEKAALLATIGPAVDGGVVLSGHTDVVPVTGQTWASDPFRLSVRDGRAYGRGAVDMKGFLAIVLALVPEMVAADLARPIHILFSYDEETTCLGCLDAIAAFGVDVPRPAAAIVGEPTSLEVADAHKGVSMCDTHVTGTQAHSSRPDDGASAVAAACAFGAGLLAIGDRLRAAGDATGRFDPPFTSLHIATMAGGTARNVFAANATLEWELRTLPGIDLAAVAGEVDALAERIARERLGRFGTIVNHWAVEVPPLAPEPGSAAEVLGLRIARRNRPVTVAYGSEAGRFQAAGIPTVLCGPGDIARAHKADEFVALDELAQGEIVLRRLIEALTRGGWRA